MEIIYIVVIVFSILVFLGITIDGASIAVFKKQMKNYESGTSTLSRSASEVCKEVCRKKKLDVQVARTPNKDYAFYDFKNKVIALSDGVYTSFSPISIAISLHEVGHAMQDRDETHKFKVYKAFSLGSKILTPIFWLSFIAGIVLLLAVPYELLYAYVAFAVMGASALCEFIFKVSTVAMEKQASKFALGILKEEGFTEDELELAKSVYKSALTTYVAGIFDPVVKVFNGITWVIYNTIGRLFR